MQKIDLNSTLEIENDQNSEQSGSSSKVWARLYPLLNTLQNSTRNDDVPPIDVDTENLIMGRQQDCCHPRCLYNDKKISSKHCVIFREKQNPVDSDSKQYIIYLADTSVNGTYVNGVKVGRGKRKQLDDGDIIAILQPNSEVGASFLFEDLCNRTSETSSEEDEMEEEEEEEPLSQKKKPSQHSQDEDVPLPLASGAKRKPDENTPVNNNNNDAPVQTKKLKTDSEDLEEQLICGICHEILHQCCTMIPCMHNFCQGCIAEWWQRNKHCPECRNDIISVRRNHSLIGVIESYLQQHPEKKRDDKDTEDLEKSASLPEIVKMIQSNKLTESSEPKMKKHPSFSSIGFGLLSPFGMRPTQCRECINPAADGFRCQGNHLTCSACWQPFPNRQNHPAVIKCEHCTKVFCDKYWGCIAATNGRQTLKKLTEWEINEFLPSALYHNVYEQQVVKDYLTDQNKDINWLYHKILQEIDEGKLTYNQNAAHVDSKSDQHVCYHCAQELFGNLSYEWRKNLPKDQIREVHRKRPDCYYGKNCRTQTHNPQHASRYNHICEQTRQ